MKNILQLVSISIILFLYSSLSSQDVIFSQFENVPLYLNPSLTGNFDGNARFILNYRNQWPKILKKYSYKTGSLSIDSNLKLNNSDKLGLGFNTIFDKAGHLNFQTNQYNFLTSINHDFDKMGYGYHSISFGINFSFVTSKIDLKNVNFPDPPNGPEPYNSNKNYFNLSSGVLWEFNSNSRFSFQFGSSIHNINKPNISFHKFNQSNLLIRYGFHGNAEVPLIRRVSLVPSFMFTKQGYDDQLLIGLANKWYFLPENFSNFLQIGLYGKTTLDVKAKRSFSIYVLTAILDLNSFSIGFSYDRFGNIDDAAYEFSIGYTINNKTAIKENIVLN